MVFRQGLQPDRETPAAQQGIRLRIEHQRAGRGDHAALVAFDQLRQHTSLGLPEHVLPGWCEQRLQRDAQVVDHRGIELEERHAQPFGQARPQGRLARPAQAGQREAPAPARVDARTDQFDQFGAQRRGHAPDQHDRDVPLAGFELGQEAFRHARQQGQSTPGQAGPGAGAPHPHAELLEKGLFIQRLLSGTHRPVILK